MPIKKLKEYLGEQRVQYESIAHSPTYTSQKTAASAHIPGKELAKKPEMWTNHRIPIGSDWAAFQHKPVRGDKEGKACHEADDQTVHHRVEAYNASEYDLFEISIVVHKDSTS